MRQLVPSERALWARLAAGVRPLPGKARPRPLTPVVAATAPHKATPNLITAPPARSPPKAPGNTLDGSWDKRLATGRVAPDRLLDLHGLTLADAHRALDSALASSLAAGHRLILLVTGKARGDSADRLRPGSRGVIRASIVDWIEAGPFAAEIAAIRPAHPRHGGGGALYLVLRRARERR